MPDPDRRLREVTDPDALRRLVASGILLAREHSLDDILKKIVDTARELVGARFAALGVIDESHGETILEDAPPSQTDGRRVHKLKQFVTSGLPEDEVRRIGSLPLGRGILGVLFDDPEPVRLENLSADPRSVGFPPGHPRMVSFLGVRISAKGQVFGNLYLTEKIGEAAFSEHDEAIAVVLAKQAGVAIENARLLQQVEEQARSEIRRTVLRHAIEAQEEERRRLARELHDETGQSLTAVMLTLRVLERSGLADAAQAQIAELRQQVGDALREVRNLAVRLRPTALDDLGLVAAIERLVDDTAGVAGIAVMVDAKGLSDRRLDPAVETVLYRFVQEALTNIVKHSEAGGVSISLTVEGDHVTARVSDDGRGFDPEVPVAGVGLLGMRERIELVDGTFAVDSSPGAGTTVTARVPAQPESDETEPV